MQNINIYEFKDDVEYIDSDEDSVYLYDEEEYKEIDENSGYVYINLFANESFLDNLVKFGKSINIEQRKKNYETGSTIIHCEEKYCDNRHDIEFLLSVAFHKFREKNKNGN